MEIADTRPRTVLVIGALGQIGQELTAGLRSRYGTGRVIASDVRLPAHAEGPFVQLDALDAEGLTELLRQEQVTEVYHLAAMLSAKGEQHPLQAWDINMRSLLIALEAARGTGVRRMFWPSSIAAFGPGTPHDGAPQHTVMDPSTVYGISKLAGEHWCAYYAARYGLDVRSLRYPGLISYKTPPGGGTTDYAVHIFHAAVTEETYTSFLGPDTRLPMMYMPDAIRATIELMEAPAEQVRVRTSYNLQGFSFTPAELAAAIQRRLPSFTVQYAPDFREAIAASWPASMDDQAAREDWGWAPAYTLDAMVDEMLAQIRLQYPAVLPS
ncbi:MAG: NAD-dependent epimerase/dehydratase family protein [Bacteroidia bacterium]|nr:NAD-dependent epimerase/dehydratase family protein [Bacteroidia bacterium]